MVNSLPTELHSRHRQSLSTSGAASTIIESLSKRTKSDDDDVVDNFCLSCTFILNILCLGSGVKTD
jgi:hypothetical protein